MSSPYAPLPFSYLAPDAAKPRVGLRKDGVYGTSADVPRIYEGPEIGLADNHYNVYANANDTSAAQHGRTDTYEEMYRPSQSAHTYGLTPRPQESPYEVNRRPDLIQDRSQKPGGEYSNYIIPEADYVLPDRDLQRGPRNPGYGYQDAAERPSRQEHVQSYYPPQDAGRKTPDEDKFSRGQKEITSNDNFILVKDPNRIDQKVVPDVSSSGHDPGKTKLQALFDEKGSTPLMPRQTTPNQNPSNETGYENPNTYSLYYGGNTKERPMGPGEGPKETAPPSGQRDQSAYSTKSGQGKQCCRCSTCSAVVAAIIITAVVCLGAGFVAGWFGAIADREKNVAYPANQSTDTLTEHQTATTIALNSLSAPTESSTLSKSTSTTKTTTTTATQLSSTTKTSTSNSYTSTSSTTAPRVGTNSTK